MKRRFFVSNLFSAGLSGGLMTAGLSAPLFVNVKRLRAESLAWDSGDAVIGEPDALLASLPPLTVYRSPTCGCCGAWVEHMEAHGFRPQVRMSDDMDAIKQHYGIPEVLASCHTAVMDGYLVEGHVPADDLQRLLLERPDVAGLSVPGMPMGSPGMEQGDARDPYTVYTFTQGGDIAAFAKHS
ncbi:MAG: DUF411 domain-containing protein [Cyanobacteria bacterium P01_F01_bin.53]